LVGRREWLGLAVLALPTMLLIGGSAFAVASVLAAYAPSAEMLSAARALLGIAGHGAAADQRRPVAGLPARTAAYRESQPARSSESVDQTEPEDQTEGEPELNPEPTETPNRRQNPDVRETSSC